MNHEMEKVKWEGKKFLGERRAASSERWKTANSEWRMANGGKTANGE
jgi:hypothetical protein